MDAKYKRSIEGKTLSLPDCWEVSTSSSPRALRCREKIYKQILLNPACELGKDDDEFFIAPILYPSTVKSAVTVKRSLQSTPIKVLDAPGLEDDFYQNLLDWDLKKNRLCVLLNGREVYFWNATGTAGTSSLGRSKSAVGGSKACVVKVQDDKVAIGTKTGVVEVWDQERGILMHSYQGHADVRCGVLSWQSGDEVSSGGRDGRVVHYDLRLPRGIAAESLGHTQEICGLKWNESKLIERV